MTGGMPQGSGERYEEKTVTGELKAGQKCEVEQMVVAAKRSRVHVRLMTSQGPRGEEAPSASLASLCSCSFP